MKAALLLDGTMALITTAFAVWANVGAVPYYLVYWAVWIGLTVIAYSTAALVAAIRKERHDTRATKHYR
jgi:hypothetical protein